MTSRLSESEARIARYLPGLVVALLALTGCGRAVHTQSAVNPPAPLPQGHPQAVQPVAGQVPQAPHPQLPQGSSVKPSITPGESASATTKIAAGAPTDAEVRAAVAKFQAAVRKYHLDQLNFNGVLIDPAKLPPGQYYSSIASVFTDYGLPVACGGVEHVTELGVANKTLPCGTMVTFIYGGRAIRVPVIDRGPYIAGREWDLTGATAEALHFPGLGPITWRIG